MLSQQDMLEAERLGRSVKSIYVYEAPVRLWHWINALAIVVLAVTGYFIGSPPPSMPGEASANYLMGYIRFAHFAAGYVFAVALIGRVYWAFVGNHHARELFTLPVFQKAYWREVLVMVRWYSFTIGRPSRYVGHNPLARFAMVVIFMLSLLFMIVTGFALYGEGTGMNSWAFKYFSSWVLPLFGYSQNVHTLHHLGMWYLIVFTIAHAGERPQEPSLFRYWPVSERYSWTRSWLPFTTRETCTQMLLCQPVVMIVPSFVVTPLTTRFNSTSKPRLTVTL